MLELRDAAPVKAFAGLIVSPGPDLALRTFEAMRAIWGPIDATHGPVSFDLTDYYEAEMGPGLERLFAGFERLISPADLPEWKHQANAVEAEFAAADGRRRVNIDVGYLDFHKVVLASTKAGPTKIYLGRGIWADMTLRYASGRFEAFPWTFPDFADGRYDAFFLALRDRYRKARRAGRG